jgi:hypothetical protein
MTVWQVFDDGSSDDMNCPILFSNLGSALIYAGSKMKNHPNYITKQFGETVELNDNGFIVMVRALKVRD